MKKKPRNLYTETFDKWVCDYKIVTVYTLIIIIYVNI